MSKTTLVVIPYLSAGAQGSELQTAIRGWQTFFDGDMRLVVIGDNHPCLKELGVEYIKCERSQANAGNPPLDVVAKMRHLIGQFGGDVEGCVWTNDDIYAVNHFGIKDVKLKKIIDGTLNGRTDSGNHFIRNMYRTRVALEKDGLPIYNYSAHLPVWYDFSRLEELFDHFSCDTEAYLINSLYHNYFYSAKNNVRVNVAKEGNRYKCGIYTREFSIASLEEAIKNGVIWVNNSWRAYRPEILKVINQRIDTINNNL